MPPNAVSSKAHEGSETAQVPGIDVCHLVQKCRHHRAIIATDSLAILQRGATIEFYGNSRSSRNNKGQEFWWFTLRVIQEIIQYHVIYAWRTNKVQVLCIATPWLAWPFWVTQSFEQNEDQMATCKWFCVLNGWFSHPAHWNLCGWILSTNRNAALKMAPRFLNPISLQFFEVFSIGSVSPARIEV